MKMEIISEHLEAVKFNFPILETKYSVKFFIFTKYYGNNRDEEVLWIRGPVKEVHLAKIELMVPIQSQFFTCNSAERCFGFV